jgi:hypothetical protein
VSFSDCQLRTLGHGRVHALGHPGGIPFGT